MPSILDAPTHHHLAYRPGVPLVRRTIGPLADEVGPVDGPPR